MQNFIEVTEVTFPNAGYYGGMNEPKYSAMLINLFSVSRIIRTSKKYCGSEIVMNDGTAYCIKEPFSDIKNLVFEIKELK